VLTKTIRDALFTLVYSTFNRGTYEPAASQRLASQAVTLKGAQDIPEKS
jgi:hypothetical protein